MSFWDGTRWDPDDPAPALVTHASRRKHIVEAVAEGALVGLLAIALVSGTAFAAKGGNGKGGGSGASATMTFAASPDVVQAGDLFDVAGCGFDTSLGNVIVGFTGGSWGSPLDSAGCFTITGIPALSGDTLAPGTYDVTAYQYIHGRWTKVDATTITVVAA